MIVSPEEMFYLYVLPPFLLLSKEYIILLVQKVQQSEHARSTPHDRKYILREYVRVIDVSLICDNRSRA